MSRASQLAFATLAVFALAGCGGGQKTTSTNGTTTSGNAMQTQASPSQGTMGGAAVPADLSCGAVRPVWVNTRTHVYHEPNDPAYGHTKSGKYLCPSAARAEGDRPAGGGSMSGRHKRSRGSY